MTYVIALLGDTNEPASVDGPVWADLNAARVAADRLNRHAETLGYEPGTNRYVVRALEAVEA